MKGGIRKLVLVWILLGDELVCLTNVMDGSLVEANDIDSEYESISEGKGEGEVRR